MYLVDEFIGKGGKFGPLTGAQVIHPDSLRPDIDLFENVIYPLHPCSSTDVAVDVMAIAFKTTDDHNAVGPIFESLEQ